jgi:hypothetical protein
MQQRDAFDLPELTSAEAREISGGQDFPGLPSDPEGPWKPWTSGPFNPVEPQQP